MTVSLSLSSDERLSDCYESSVSSFSSTKPNATSPSCSAVDSPSRSLYLPQSLLILIHRHLLNRLLTPSLKWKFNQPRRSLVKLNANLLTFFKSVGYVSHRLFESALLAVKLFLNLTRVIRQLKTSLMWFYLLLFLE
ncbi:hypothetical protein GEMRC1_010203 [Eukaryota sp. GEM-RC1]